MSATPLVTFSPTPAVPTPTATPEPTSLEIAWSDQQFDGQVGAAIADHGGFVAVSSDPEHRLAWSSSDGRSWSSAVAPDPAPTGCGIEDITRCFANNAGMGQLVRLDDTLYSFGTACCFNDYFRPVGWRLTDGAAWQAIESQSAFFTFGGMIDVAASDAALVASTANGLGATARVWRWSSDSSWVEAEVMGQRERLSVDDLAWSDRRFMAVGVEDAFERRFAPALWSSRDGKTWTAVAAPDDARYLCSVSGTSAGFIVLGATRSSMAAWTGSESGEFTRIDLASPPLGVGDPYDLRESCGVVELDKGLLAFRRVEDGTLTWTTRNGVTWEAGNKLDVIAGPDLIAAMGDTVVVFGTHPGPPSGSGQIPSRLFIGRVD